MSEKFPLWNFYLHNHRCPVNPKTAIPVAERGTRFDIAGFGVNGVLIFEIMLFFIDKSRENGVTDLIFLEWQML